MFIGPKTFKVLYDFITIVSVFRFFAFAQFFGRVRPFGQEHNIIMDKRL